MSANAAFWDHVAPLLASGDVEEGTIMGGRCIRVRGEFLAMPHHQVEGMVVKLPKERVAEIIGQGRGQPFSPNGRVFKEWLHVPSYDAELWNALLAEARIFVSR
jgi:hypothetical protein